MCEHRELLSHVERINSMGEMASAMAHELNQPLTAISLYATTAQSLFLLLMVVAGFQRHRRSSFISRFDQVRKRVWGWDCLLVADVTQSSG